MGWTETRATNYNNGKVLVKEEVKDLIDDNYYEILKISNKGSVYYMACRDKETGDVIGAVVRTSVNNRSYFNFGYRVISENEGPCECECPESILKLLTPTDEKWANEWREKCHKYNEEQRKAPKLSALPVGTVIKARFIEGEVYLTKCAPAYQFKRTWWSTGYGYVPSTRIKDYDIVELGA